MVNKTSKKSEPAQPRLLIVILASIVAVTLLTMSGYFLYEAIRVFLTFTITPLVQTLTAGFVIAAIAPIIIGLVVYKTAQGKALRRYVVAATYMTTFWLVQTAFSLFVPTYAIITNLGSEADSWSAGASIFLPYSVGIIATFAIYFASKKRTMNVNHLGLAVFLALTTGLLLLDVWSYFFPFSFLPY